MTSRILNFHVRWR